VGDWRFLARLSHYDEWYDSFEFDVFGTIGFFDAETLLDLEVAYDFSEKSSLLFGINNVFDNKGQTINSFHAENNPGIAPGFNASRAAVGNVYSQYSPFGFSGSFWYLNYRYTY